MNDINEPEGTPHQTWTDDAAHRTPVPDTSLLLNSENPPPPAVQMLQQAVRGAHDGIDRLAETAAPAVRRLGERVSAVEDELQAKSEQWRETGDAWVDAMRTTVRRNPLACLAGALALGALIARIGR